MHRRQALLETREVAGGVVAYCRWPCAGGYIDGEAFVPVGRGGGIVAPGVSIGEVGRFGSRLKKAARAAAKSKVLRGIARTAMRVVKQTPYGQAATAALNVARSAARAARGEGRRASALARGATPPRSNGRRGRTSPLTSLSDRQKLQVIRAVLRARGGSRFKLSLIEQAVS